MSEYFMPGAEPGHRAREAWPTTIETLPIGTHVTGRVIGRQPFGVFFHIDQAPDAIGLIRVTSYPVDVELPGRGAAVAGEVLWLEARNHQVIVTPSAVDRTE